MKDGLLYILVNPCLDGWIKIGITDDLNQRLRQLNNRTAVPLSYRVYATLEVDGERLKMAEDWMHAQFDKFRAKEISDTGKIVRTREFFSITPEDAYEHLTKVAFAFKLKDATKYKETTLDKKAQEIAEEAKEVRDYNAGDITYANDHIQAIYSKIKNYTLGLDSSVVEEPKKVYIAFKIGTKNFVDISVHRNSLKLFLNVKSGELEDPKGLARDLEIDGHIGHHGNGDYEVRITDDSNLDYIKQLIKYSYEKNK